MRSIAHKKTAQTKELQEKEIFMIIALDEAKRRLLDMEEILQELGNQLRIEEAKERAAELERETMVENFWNDAEKSSKKLQRSSS